jgi:hypothetical protein
MALSSAQKVGNDAPARLLLFCSLFVLLLPTLCRAAPTAPPPAALPLWPAAVRRRTRLLPSTEDCSPLDAEASTAEVGVVLYIRKEMFTLRICAVNARVTGRYSYTVKNFYSPYRADRI